MRRADAGRRRLAALLLTTTVALTGVAVGCASPQRPGVRFADSSAFRAIDSSTFGILEDDVNRDGMPDAVVIRQVGPGFAATMFLQKAVEEGDAWDEVCTGPVVRGGELQTLRWVTPGSGRLLLMTATTENPDEALERAALIDMLEGCAVRFEERVQLNRPNGLPIAPDGLSGGVLVDGNGHLAIVDQPKYFTLQGPEGEAAILTEVRLRRVVGHRREVRVEESTHKLLRPVPLEVRWVPAVDPPAPETAAPALPSDIEVLSDGDDRTSFVARPGEQGELIIEAERPIVALEVRHGCHDQEESVLQLGAGDAPLFTLGTQPPPESFVLAAGRTPERVQDVRRDLLAPRVRQDRWALRLGPLEAERCLRGLKAFAFVGL